MARGPLRSDQLTARRLSSSVDPQPRFASRARESRERYSGKVTSAPDATRISLQVAWLLLLALPIATVTWTITHEEIFREAREYCSDRSKRCRRLIQRKFFYVFTCEYCLSHYVAGLFIILTGFRLLLDDWRGYVLALFALVAVANMYMSLFGRLRVDIKSERLEVAVKEREVEEREVEAHEAEEQSAR